MLQQVYRMDQKMVDYCARGRKPIQDLRRYRRQATQKSQQMVGRINNPSTPPTPARRQLEVEDCICLFPEAHERANHAAEYEKALHHERKMEEIRARKTSRYRDKLRASFVKKAKQYIGRTYSELNCCGLVRQCVHDLPLFGFRLDTCNQGVMFDSLKAHEIEAKDLKPGDLIFYKGEYLDEHKEPKMHDIVHVEIFLGHPDHTW